MMVARRTYIHVRLVVVVHGHLPKLGADIDQRLDEDIHQRIVLWKSGHGLLKEIQVDGKLIIHITQEVRHQCIVL